MTTSNTKKSSTSSSSSSSANNNNTVSTTDTSSSSPPSNNNKKGIVVHQQEQQLYFPVHKHSPVFKRDVATKLVGYGCKRVKRSNIGSFDPVMKHSNLMTHSDLQLQDCIGQGSFSSVYSVKSVTNVKVEQASNIVVKVLRKKTMEEPKMFAACAGDLFKEALMLASLNHPNVIGAHAFGSGGINAYKSGRHDAFFIVLEKLEETLSDRIKRWQKNSKTPKHTLLFTSHHTSHKQTMKKIEVLQSKTSTILQLCHAIQYIHSQGMIHRDLKPDNIGFDKVGTLKVFDFDVARVLPTDESENQDPTTFHPDETFKLTKRTGSPRYMSPECALGEPYNAKTDVYSFGLLVHEILTLKKPYQDIPAEYHDEEVFLMGERPSVPVKHSWTAGLSNVVTRCWSPKIGVRPTMVEARDILEVELPMLVSQKLSKKLKHKNKWFVVGNKSKTTSSSTAGSNVNVTKNTKLMLFPQ